ncbi:MULTISPECIES: L-serine ammonia-lyase [unclassified Aureimonas]|uniref:L-serine ammonia-lyase n=1 Tax=unclassified Aureimonas TaxID=2615206 RepID=UPI0007003342|nr:MULTISPECIES: L-serine ammonia-lyase [unclassified Aureimonas]KQT61758.1 serine dehydratase [Aureimonas sp. Leaf460]KQT65733.1 serine dehydratase [Aureimonas sp. Leaf427]
MISIFELFKVGIGPSSSHTVGPMKAALAFAGALGAAGLAARTARVRVDLFGSLAWTGKGHGTDKAVMLGLAGEAPETVDPDRADALVESLSRDRRLPLGGGAAIGFDPAEDIVFDGLSETPRHPNTMALTAFDASGAVLHDERWCSVGGGFIVPEAAVGEASSEARDVPYPFRSGRHLLAMAGTSGLSIAEMVFANECALRPAADVEAHVVRVHETMMACIDRGLSRGGRLPGGLDVARRASALRQRLEAEREAGANDRAPHEIMDWVSLYAIAVNEENAAGGRVVTAPTNGAAGVVPAVLRYYREHCPGGCEDGARTFLLTATAVGGLFKMNASISGAEVGCQGEVGVACSMAAAGLCAALGGTVAQIENAAEIGMEHHLGLTCDPIGGLVQIPCIERNAFGAVSAIQAASLALRGDGTHVVSLDKVIHTMRETGRDMQSKYKETSQGGLAVNFPEC